MRRSFWQGAAWLTIGAFASKLIGAVYRVFLPRVLGDTGVGLFQMAYPIYAVVLAVSVSGVPIALSKLTAEMRAIGRDQDADRLADWALIALGSVGLVLSLAMMAGAAWLASEVFHEPLARYAIQALAPAIALVALQAGLRGFFQGHQDMKPTALSQILEQFCRVVVMFPLALWLLPEGVAQAAGGATLGAPAGALAGLIYLAFRRRRTRPWRLQGPPPWRSLWRLVEIAAPMAMSALLFPLMLLTDSLVVPTRLMGAGLSANAATAAYGRLSGEAMPLINLTLVVGTALAVSLVPAIAEALSRAQRDRAQERVGMAIHAIWLAALPMAGGMFVLAAPICTYLYGEPGAAGALRVLALGTAFFAMQQVLGNSLQAAGQGWTPVRNLLAGAVLKFGLAWWLVPIWGIRGAGASSVVAALVATLLNWQAWTRAVGTPAQSPWMTATIPLIATVLMVLAVQVYLAAVVVTPVTAVLAILMGGALYLLLVFLLGERRFLETLWRLT